MAKKKESHNDINQLNQVDSAEFKKVGNRVAIVGIVGNILLTVFKFIAGILANSGAMISDAVHSASDIVATFLVLIGINISCREEDENHPYGHEKIECIFALGLAVILFVIGLEIGKSGIKNIWLSRSENLVVPGSLALVAAVVSVITKELMFRYTASKAKKINSSSLMADAWHHRTDALSSVGSFIGILGAKLGFPVMDPIASLFICVLILKAAYEISADALRKIIDVAWSKEKIEKLKNDIIMVEGVERIDEIKTRQFGAKVYVDIEISVDEKVSFVDAHEISEVVHELAEKKYPEIKHCMVHVNPISIS